MSRVVHRIPQTLTEMIMDAFVGLAPYVPIGKAFEIARAVEDAWEHRPSDTNASSSKTAFDVESYQQ